MTSGNGTPVFLDESRAQGLANYPHARIVGNTVYVSGTSSRRGDGTHEGVTVHTDGSFITDVFAQTRAVLTNIASILELVQPPLSLANVVDATVFLVDIADYADMNKAWNEFFPDRTQAPARTTVAVHQLPNAKLRVEIKVTAVLA